MTKPKLVTAGVQWRGQWDIVRFRWDKRELDVQVKKDTMVDGSKVLEFELGGLCSEPLKECNFVIVEIGVLKDVKVPLTLLCMSQWVVDVASNGGLMYVCDICRTIFGLAPHKCSPGLSMGSHSLSAHTLRASHQVEHYVRMTCCKLSSMHY